MPIQLTNLVQILYLGLSFNYIQPVLLILDLPLKLRVAHIRNKKRTWNFTNMINCFCCYVIKSAGEIAKRVLLSIFWNLLLIEINLSQIRISGSKREKVCAVCPYLLFTLKKHLYASRCSLHNFLDLLLSPLHTSTFGTR